MHRPPDIYLYHIFFCTICQSRKNDTSNMKLVYKTLNGKNVTKIILYKRFRCMYEAGLIFICWITQYYLPL